MAWTADDTGTWTIETRNTSFDTVLYVLDGSCEATELACNDDRGPDDDRSRVEFFAVEDRTYYIVVDSSDQYEYGGFELQFNN